MFWQIFQFLKRKMRNSFFCFIDLQVQISVDAFNEFGSPADIDFFWWEIEITDSLKGYNGNGKHKDKKYERKMKRQRVRKKDEKTKNKKERWKDKE